MLRNHLASIPVLQPVRGGCSGERYPRQSQAQGTPRNYLGNPAVYTHRLQILEESMEDKHRRRTLVGRILDWYHGSSDFVKDRRFPSLARRNEASRRRDEQGVRKEAWYSAVGCHHLCKAVGYCVATGGRCKRHSR